MAPHYAASQLSIRIRQLALGGAIVALALGASGCKQQAETTPEADALASASGTPTPDQAAWQQFILAVTPSATSGKVAYETWASDQDIYVTPCTSPNNPSGCGVPNWPTSTSLDAPKALTPSKLSLSHQGADAKAQFGVEVIGPAQGCVVPTTSIQPPTKTQSAGAAFGSGFPASGCVGEEVRRDRASFDYLAQNGLWSTAGLAKFYAAKGTVAFPTNALEVKADWIPVATLATWLNKPQSFVTTNFYTASAVAQAGGPSVSYALTSMHVSVKTAAFPEWIWANFENAYTPGRCDQTGCSDSYGATVPKVPANSATWGQYGACAKPAALLNQFTGAKVAAVFGNYCLTGTQTSFGTTTSPTLLGSPIIEPLNANVPLSQSSCISCHSVASFDVNGKHPPFTDIGGIGPQKPPAGYTAYDFMWGVLGAH